MTEATESIRVSGVIATEVWDLDASLALGARQVELARETGALVQLQFALNFLANNEMLAGELAAAYDAKLTVRP